MSERNVTPGLPFRVNFKMVILVLAAAVLGFTAFTSAYVVDATEEAVILTLGKYNRTEGPGLRFKLPFGIEENFNVATNRVLDMNFGFYKSSEDGPIRNVPEESVMLTGDKNILDVQWVIQYQIVDARKWLFNIDPRAQRKTIRDISQSAINQAVGDRAVFDVISRDREKIQLEAQEMMNALFSQYEIGLRVTLVQLGNVLPPQGTVQEAFKDVQKAEQEMNQRINEGREAYNKEIPNVAGQAKQMLQEAEGYAVERINHAKGDAARFLAVLGEYRKAPEVTRTRLYYEMVESVFKDSKGSDLIDKKLEGFLPLKNLGAAGGAR